MTGDRLFRSEIATAMAASLLRHGRCSRPKPFLRLYQGTQTTKRLPSLIPRHIPALFHSIEFAGGRHKRGNSWNSILSSMLRNHEINKARQLFSEIPAPDIRLYTMMIDGYSQVGCFDEALSLFNRMPERDTPVWNSMIKACFNCGELSLGHELFDRMPERNVVTWTTMLNGFAQHGRIDAAEKLFWRMPERDTAAWNAMISAYCGNGRINDAYLLFKRMPHHNVISWTAMIGGLAQIKEWENALLLFHYMWVSGIKPTASTYACVLTACADATYLQIGTQLHGHLIRVGYLFNTFVCTSLLTMYANTKQVENLSKLFHENQERNVVFWTSLITGLGSNGMHKDALNEFNEMIKYGIRPNQSTFTSVLNSCCGLGALDRGKKIHGSTIKLGLDPDVFVANSLIVLYSKCGEIEDSLIVFNIMSRRNLVSWNSIIVGCAQNGYASHAFNIFDGMRAFNEQPDEVTYIGLLTACSHSRMLDKGRCIFQMLKLETSVDVKLEHYACMVDIVGRCGKLNEAEEFILNMPIKPNATIWLALLSACRMHSNVEVARRTSKKIFDLEPSNSAAYVLLSNIYASACKWNDVSQTRVMMRCQGIIKVPGSSWITIRDTRHEFVCCDRSHRMAPEIYKKLDWLEDKLREHGYSHDKSYALHDVDDEQKEAVLAYHSEKLAIAFGLLSTVDGSTIRVMKNLRVCGDCHSSISLISQIVERPIILRDSTRFHHFIGGICSCKGCW